MAVFQFKEVIRDQDGKAVASTSLFFRAKSQPAAVRKLKRAMRDLGRPLMLDGRENWRWKRFEEDVFAFCYPHLVDVVFGDEADDTIMDGKPVRH